MSEVELELEEERGGKRVAKRRPKKDDEVILGVFYNGGGDVAFRLNRDTAERLILSIYESYASLVSSFKADVKASSIIFVGGSEEGRPITKGSQGCVVVNKDFRTVAILDEPTD